MRNYKKKMLKLELSKERLQELRLYCKFAGHKQQRTLAQAATKAAKDEVMADFILRHVGPKQEGFAKLEADGMPCCKDNFYFMRARFYKALDMMLLWEELFG